MNTDARVEDRLVLSSEVSFPCATRPARERNGVVASGDDGKTCTSTDDQKGRQRPEARREISRGATSCQRQLQPAQQPRHERRASGSASPRRHSSARLTAFRSQVHEAPRAAMSAGMASRATRAAARLALVASTSERHDRPSGRLRDERSRGRSRRASGRSRTRVPGAASGGRKSKDGPSSSYTETWDGDKYDMTDMGMWDTLGIEGPSCFVLPPLERATREDLERVYAQAKNTYFSGQPVVDDAMFDKIERRLKYLGSDVARKYPRCSRRDMRVYSDAETDREQMWALAAAWFSLALLGAALVGLDFAEAIRGGVLGNLSGELLAGGGGSASFGEDSASAAARLGGGGVFGGPGLGRPPVLGFLGVFLAQGGWAKLASLREGSVVALTGDCPNCGERVYAFAPGDKPETRRKSECHVCERGVVFNAAVVGDKTSPFRRAATGRIYLVSRADDYYDESNANRARAEWPPKKKKPSDDVGGGKP